MLVMTGATALMITIVSLVMAITSACARRSVTPSDAVCIYHVWLCTIDWFIWLSVFSS